MAFFIGLLGLLQMVGGALAFLGSSSVMHQILGATSVGAGTICLALAAIINALHAIEIELKRTGTPN